MKIEKRQVDRVYAAAVGLVVFVLLCIWDFPGLHSSVWHDVCIASGMLPLTDPLSGLGNGIARLLFAAFPFDCALTIYVLFGKLSAAWCAYMTYGIIRGLAALLSGIGEWDIVRRTIAVRIAAVVGSFAFVCSGPLWHAAQGFTSSTAVVLLVVLAFRLFIRLLENASVADAVMTPLVIGLLAAETPMGWMVLVIAVVIAFVYLKHVRTEEWERFLSPVRLQRTKWLMTFAFLAAFGAGVLSEVMTFSSLDGLKAHGITFGEFPVLFCKSYFGRLMTGLTPLGYGMWMALVIFPFTLAATMVTQATDEDTFLSFKLTVIFIGCALVSFVNLSPFQYLWFWNIFPGCMSSSVAQLMTPLVSAMTLALAVFVLCVEVLCRNYQRIEATSFPQFSQDSADADEPTATASVRIGFGRIVILMLPLLIVVVMVAGRRLSADRELSRVLDAFVSETLDEVGDANYIFTDGAFDDALRIESSRRGKKLHPVSLLGGNSRAEAFVRQLGVEDPEDRMTLETGAAETLGTWAMSKPSALNGVCVQLAFEFLNRNRDLKPMAYGTLVRPVGGDAAAAAASIDRCHRLSDEIVELHESGTWRHARDVKVKDRLLSAQFRLAVMSRLRAIWLDAQGKTDESIAEIAYSDRLNRNNPSLERLFRQMNWVRRQPIEALSPREGVEVALRRADYVMGRRYAMPVLSSDPDDPGANFVVGMCYYAEDQLAKAEEYLKRVLKRRPNEGAVYNNLALIYLRTDRLDEAAKSAAKALELAPTSVEVKDTVEQVRKAKDSSVKPSGERR